MPLPPRIQEVFHKLKFSRPDPISSRWVWVLSSCVFLSAGTGVGLAIWGSMQSEAQEITSPAPPALAPSSNSDPTTTFRQALQALQTKQSATALSQLQGLETQLPVLADQIVMVRALTYEQAGNTAAAQQAWTALIAQYPNSPLVPRALYGSGRVDELRSRFPAHPVTGAALQSLLARQPDNITLIREQARFHPTSLGLVARLNRWMQRAKSSLSAADWQVIADAYWTQREYGKAAQAYEQAPVNSQNLYRRGRSLQISRSNATAKTIYQTLLAQYPTATEIPLARRRLADLSDATTAITLLQPLAGSEKPEAADSLLTISQLYDKAGNSAAAQTARQSLWTRFADSDAAATAAWNLAWKQSRGGQLQSAITLATQIGSAQKDSPMGAQLLFWSARWQAQLGNAQASKQTLQTVIQRNPHTYYAWRSAVRLGWPVGDFSVGRLPIRSQVSPSVQPLPGVSEAVQALYLMGAPSAAWERWQWEMGYDPNGVRDLDDALTVEQQFAAGALRNAAGDHLKGINQVANLRFDPKLSAEIRQRTDFWQTVYPLHYHDNANRSLGGDPSSQAGIAQWARQFSLNPLLVASLIRQESRFEPEIVSSSGALGLMQVMPATGQWIAGKLGVKQYNLIRPADNLRLGSWYLDYTHKTYNDNSMLAVASYNAGPGSVAKWVKQFGLSDPDLFVEQIPFEETQGYVKSVFGNYWNYWQLYTTEGKGAVSQSVKPAQ